MRGRAPLIGSGRSLSQWEPHGLSWPLTASHNLSCDLSEPIRESDPRGYRTDFTAKRIALHGRVRSDSHGLTDWPLTHTDWTLPAESPILGAIWLISRLNALLRPVCVRGRSDSQICEAVGVRARPLTRKSCDLSESPIGLPRPHTASQIRESDRPPTAGRPWESDPRADQAASPGRGATGPRIGLSRPASRGRPIGLSNLWGRSDSHGLTDRPHRSDSHYWLLII